MGFFLLFPKSRRSALGLYIAACLAHGLPTQAAPAAAREDRSELNKISLISTDGYNPRQESGREFSEFTSSFGLTFFGGIYASTALDLKGDIYQKLSAPELQRYFPKESERRAIAAKVDSQVHKRYLSGAITNEMANAAIRYAVTDIGTTLINRVLEKEGVSDAGRRAKWANRLLLPFHTCMRETKVYKEGMRCLEAFKKDALLNVGLSLSHELVRQEMGASYSAAVAPAYITCVRAKSPGADARVKSCVAKGVQSAAYLYGQAKLLETAKKQLGEAKAAAVVKRTAPGFKKCLDRAGDKKGFAACGDDLAARAGAEIAKEAILANPQVSQTIRGGQAQKEVAEAGGRAFQACAAGLVKNGARGPEGSLNLEACVHPVKMEAGRAVALEVIRQNIQKTSGAPVALQSSMDKEIAGALKACWNVSASEAKNSDCLRSSVQKLVRTLASYRLGQELPAGLVAKDPGLKEKLLQGAEKCLAESLSGNLLQASDVAARVNGCAATLVKEAALKVAAYSLKETISGKSKDAGLAAKLQRELVDGRFAACLGPAPESTKVNECAGELRRAGGSAVGQALFSENYEEFIKAGGGPAAYVTTAAAKTAFLTKVNEGLDQCLSSKAKGEAKAAEAGLNACFKASVGELALHLGNLEFRRQLKENVSRARVNADAMAADFSEALGACLAEKSDAGIALEAFIKHLDVCKLRLTKRFALEIGKRELAAAADENMPETPATKVSRKKILDGLIKNFGTCLDSVKPGAALTQEACTASLKREATESLVIAATRGQSRKQLNTGDLPPLSQQALEAEFTACVDKTKDAEGCAVKHVRGTAKAVAHLKLHHTMADMLGADYPKLIEEFNAMETDFNACLVAIPGAKVDDAFVKSTNACADSLEATGVGFSQRYLKNLLLKTRQSEKAANLSLQAALIVPCLDAIAVQKPFDENFLQKYDPEGTFEIMAKMVGDYINYDADKAGDDYETVMAQVLEDLKSAGPVEARRNLLSTLVKRGMVDQLLKSMIRAEIRKSLSELPAKERLPDEVIDQLLSRELLDKALSGPKMAEFRAHMAEKILQPVLLEGKSMKAPAQAEAIRKMKNDVADALLSSVDFGDLLIKSVVQKQIDNQAGWAITKWFAARFTGLRTLYWSEVRGTPKALAAEAFVREKLLKPRFTGERLSEEENEARATEASALVKEALK
ncbi:MAG: hypothetical protein EOP11_02155 [Proteobacteria bacterium]|nr:MAG: hypothetical protein EOP11_02155 [Pseudomonadota bacterium]